MNDPQAQQEAFAALMHERYAPFVYDDDGNMVRDENNVIVRGELTFQALKNFLDSGKASATTLTNPQKVEKLVKTNTDMGDLVAMVAPIVDRIATLEHDNAILGGDQPSPLTDLAAEVIGRLVDADQLQKLAELVIGRIDALTPKDEPAPETGEVIPMTGTNG